MSERLIGRLFAVGSAGFLRSTILNLLTQVIVYGAAVMCVPMILGRLGPEVFGVLTIFWIIVGAVPFLDLGLSQATVRFVSSALANQQSGSAELLVHQILRTALAIGMGLALLAGLLMLSVPVLGVSLEPELQSHAQLLAGMIALVSPALLVAGPLRGVPQAARRFDLVNAVQGGTGIVQWVGTLVVVLLGGGLTSLLTFTVLVRYGSAAASLGAVRIVLPDLRWRGRLERQSDRAVLAFGGWVFVSQAIGPLILLSERLIITVVVSLEAQGWYSGPFDALIRFLALPMSIASVLYPFMAAKSDSPDQRGQMASLYHRAARMVLILMVPVVLLLLLFGNHLLTIWLGGEIAGRVQPFWIFLVVGLLAHSLSQVPYVALQAADAPKDIAVLLLIEFPVYIPVFFLLTSTFGLAGAAMSWLLRVVAELGVLLWRTRRRLPADVAVRPVEAAASVVLLGALGYGGLMLLQQAVSSMLVVSLATLFFLIVYSLFVWTRVLDRGERAAVSSGVLPLLGGRP